MQYLDTLASAYPAHPLSVILFLIMLISVATIATYLFARASRLLYRLALLCRNHFYPPITTAPPRLTPRS